MSDVQRRIARLVNDMKKFDASTRDDEIVASLRAGSATPQQMFALYRTVEEPLLAQVPSVAAVIRCCREGALSEPASRGLSLRISEMRDPLARLATLVSYPNDDAVVPEAAIQRAEPLLRAVDNPGPFAGRDAVRRWLLSCLTREYGLELLREDARCWETSPNPYCMVPCLTKTEGRRLRSLMAPVEGPADVPMLLWRSEDMGTSHASKDEMGAPVPHRFTPDGAPSLEMVFVRGDEVVPLSDAEAFARRQDDGHRWTTVDNDGYVAYRFVYGSARRR